MFIGGKGDLSGRQTDVKIKVERERESKLWMLSFPLWLEHVTPPKERAGHWGGERMPQLSLSLPKWKAT